MVIKRVVFVLFLFSTICFEAQNTDYAKLWQTVEAYELEGLPKSALKAVQQIENKAIEDKNDIQLIKTLLFKSKFALQLEEDAQLHIINDFKTRISQSEFPTKHILESMLANLYWQYFNQNRWKFYNRTKTSEKVDEEDFRTWDLQTVFDEIHAHYANSLQNKLLLQLEPLEKFSSLLNEERGSRIYRPTLFDFLSHEALKFYKTDETHITKPAYKFEIDDTQFLSDAASFSTLNITSKDSTSLQLNALNIYKDLIQFHLKDASPYALADVNIERLKFVNEHAIFNEKEAVLLSTLKSEGKRLKKHEVSALYDFEIASIYYQQSKTYVPKTNEIHRWKAKEAMLICNTIIVDFNKSEAAEKAVVLKSRIRQKTLQLRTETFLPIQKEARILVDYTNMNALNFKAYQLSNNVHEKFFKTYRQDEQWKFIQNLKPVEIWESKLKNEGDFQRHTTEVLLPKLNNGRYLIVASKTENPETNFAFTSLQVTDLALVETETPKHKIFQIINRNNGAPIANTEVTISYFLPRNSSKQVKKYTTNTFGEIEIDKTQQWLRNINLKVKNGDDTAYFGDFYLNQFYERTTPKINYNAFLFTDRGIYRPGQTVYFKGIAMQTDDGKSEVLGKESLNVALYNVNGELLKQQQLITNDFGSVAGEFILPSSGLNGRYYLQLQSKNKTSQLNTRQYFSVEEYKRPKFETKFNPVIETYKINDSVTVQGNALAFSGTNITDAKVVYRVQRKVEYPRWYFWYRSYPRGESQEITYGETLTDASGNFSITFKAIPDESTDKSSLPIFKYEVSADVTDINGETRSASTIINIGYHALTANLNVSERLDKLKKNHEITIDTKNLNGEYTPAKGVVKIYKLRPPSSVIRLRPWPAPDYQEWSKSDFKALFPHDAYADEHLAYNWEKGELVFENPFNTEISNKILLRKLKKWTSGKYAITLESKDKFGQMVKDEVRTDIYSVKDRTLPDTQLFSISTDKSSYQVGNTALITIGSAARNIAVTVTVEKDKEVVRKEVITLNNNKRVISVPVTENDLGGFAVSYSFAAFNSFKKGKKIIVVPYPKTDLEIETVTFRDKLQPGTDETWQFKIKGPKGDKVSAELLASMYDASLDQFKTHQWRFNPIFRSNYYSSRNSNASLSFGTQNFRVYQDRFRYNYDNQSYDTLNWFGFEFINQWDYMFKSAALESVQTDKEVVVGYGTQKRSGITGAVAAVSPQELNKGETSDDLEETLSSISEEKAKEIFESLNNKKQKPNFANIKIRKNLEETAFFFPQLQTDENGNISFSFTTPEALSQWKLQLLAHTKTLESATINLTAVTQKELMVIPNAPRYLREGDNITISTKIANLTDQPLSGQAKLILTDAISGKEITSKLRSSPSLGELEGAFSVAPAGNTQVSWNLSIPEDIQAIQYKILATTGDYSDGERNMLPVLSNRMLVTETLPMWVKGYETRTFTLDKLKTNTSTTLKQHQLTLEITSNPAWYAVQALPYLMEYPYECNEQTFSRYYANALASHIVNSNPRIQDVFNQWKNTDALVSNLEKNEELKSILIQETPWLRDAQSETEQQKRVALLFDLNKMRNELQIAVNKLKNNQMPSGAWSWFKGGYENRYITQHIIAGFGHLNKLNVISTKRGTSDEKSHYQMIEKAIKYLDSEFIQEYEDIRKYDAKVDLNKDHFSHTQLHYLYMRSFFPNIKKAKKVEEVIAYYQSQIQKYWLKRSLYAKGLMALVSHRNGSYKTATKILKSLKETSITSEELGMYWKENSNSWHWYQAPIETQALLIEAFGEIEDDTETIDDLKIWLLKNKQTNRWKTTKATTEAVYALLLQGSDWLTTSELVDITIGNKKLEPKTLEDVNIETGTGYFKTSWKHEEVTPELGDVVISKKDEGIAWGALYWQYFEDLDKITSAETPLRLSKKLFLKKNTDKGEEISEITSDTNLNVGDLVRVRIELKSDRPMEFIHMKDMRASGLEPVNVLSTYKWQDGLGYYETTKDASTNFFFDYLPKGVYVFEYDLRVNNAGHMSNGITTIQSMYAPEFSSHSEGIRIRVK